MKMKAKLLVLMLTFALVLAGCNSNKNSTSNNTSSTNTETSTDANGTNENEESDGIYGEVTEVGEDSITIATGTMEHGDMGQRPEGTGMPANGDAGQKPEGTGMPANGDAGQRPEGTGMPANTDMKGAGGGFTADGESLVVTISDGTTITKKTMNKDSDGTEETIAVTDIAVGDIIKITGEETDNAYQASAISVVRSGDMQKPDSNGSASTETNEAEDTAQ